MSIVPIGSLWFLSCASVGKSACMSVCLFVLSFTLLLLCTIYIVNLSRFSQCWLSPILDMSDPFLFFWLTNHKVYCASGDIAQLEKKSKLQQQQQQQQQPLPLPLYFYLLKTLAYCIQLNFN